QEVGVAVAGIAQIERAPIHQALNELIAGPDRRDVRAVLGRADRDLVARQSHMLGGVLRRDHDRQAGLQRQVDHLTVDALWMQVELEWATAARHALEHLGPEALVALGDATLAVYAQRHTGDAGACLEDGSQGVTAVGSMVLGRQASDLMAGRRALGPGVAM